MKIDEEHIFQFVTKDGDSILFYAPNIHMIITALLNNMSLSYYITVMDREEYFYKQDEIRSDVTSDLNHILKENYGLSGNYKYKIKDSDFFKLLNNVFHDYRDYFKEKVGLKEGESDLELLAFYDEMLDDAVTLYPFVEKVRYDVELKIDKEVE